MADTELVEESSQSLVRNARAVSVVWDYFGTIVVTEEQNQFAELIRGV